MAAESNSAERVPPQAVEVEAAVLGAMLLDQEAISRVIDIIDETDFYRDAHRKIFQAAVSLFERNEPTDLITLTAELETRKQLNDVGGAFYLAGLTETVSTAANASYHANIVHDKAISRKLITSSNQIIARAFEQADTPDDLLDEAEQMIFALSERRVKQGFTQLNPILHDTFENIERLHERSSGVTGVPTGFDRLDEMTAGFQPGDLIIVAARPSMGKTAFCLNIARHAAVEGKFGVGIFSLEMANHQLAQRMLCSEARVDSHLMRTGRLPGDAWSNLSIAVGSLAQAPIFIDETPAITVLEMRSRARRLLSENENLGMLIVDYLQLMSGPSGSESRQQEISTISRSLKALAKELNIPIMALSQLSRAVESRGDGRPQLSDLRESGAIEQDADVVLFIYRPVRYGQVEETETNRAEIIIGKQRNGPIGSVELVFIDQYATFENPDFHHDPFDE
ncbi:MAG: replicative DNA helicase [Candidatus Latescibacteria bacterium]|jgi:replicative DNA helicase|nr:replicative DNA helicase [Candidatus Latescibacterota bacterium]